MNPMRKIITPGQHGEGWVQFVDGVIINRRYVGAIRRLDGNYEVEWPQPGDGVEFPGGDRLPTVDAR